MADTKLLFYSSRISTHNSLHMSYKSTLEFPFSWEIDKNESLCRTGFLKRNFLFPFPSESTKASEFPFFLLYSSLSLPSRDNHINLLNFKDIISMSATSPPLSLYPPLLGGLQFTYFCREGMRLIRDILPYCAKGCVIGDEYKEAVGRTRVWKRNQFVTPTTRL